MTTLIRRVRDALQTINVGSLTGDLLDLGAEITPFKMLGVRLTETPRPVIRITVDGGITKANLTESDPDSTVSASAIIDGAPPQESPREWSAAVLHKHQ